MRLPITVSWGKPRLLTRDGQMRDARPHVPMTISALLQTREGNLTRHGKVPCVSTGIRSFGHSLGYIPSDISPSPKTRKEDDLQGPVPSTLYAT